MTPSVLINSVLFTPLSLAESKHEMPYRTLRLSIVLASLVTLYVAAIIALAYISRGQMTTQAAIFIGAITTILTLGTPQIISIGKMAGMEQKIRHDVRGELAPVLHVAEDIDRKADVAAANAKEVKDKLEQTPLPKTWEEMEPFITRIVTKVCDERDRRNVGRDI